MRLFLLSILAIGSVHSLTIGYPYRSALLGYNPARGEFPVQSSLVQGYLRYLDSSGAERLVGYSYPEPVYGVRQVSYVSGIPAVSGHVYRAYSPEESSEFIRAREAHFRAWSLQQYQALKREIDALRAEGKQPSADMLAKYQPLEKIALTSDYASIAELPEITRIRDEHLGIWNEARIQGLQLEAGQQPIGEIKTYVGQNVPLVPAEETPEQKQARQEHLRIYNEQVNRLRQLQENAATSQVPQTPKVEQPINRLAAQAEGITEVERATQEHLRLWNEAKERAEQASYQQQGVIVQSGSKAYAAADAKQVISEVKQGQTTTQPLQAIPVSIVEEAKLKTQGKPESATQPQVAQLRFSNPVVQQPVQHEQQQIADTPEVVRAREEHLRLVNEARLRAQSVEQDELKHKHVVQVPLLKAAVHQPQQIHHDQYSSIPQFGQHVSIADTAEVVKAREQHLRLVNEAKLQLQSVDQQQQSSFNQQANFKSDFGTQQQHNVQPQVADTPEVTKAREEHLRLVNEANLKAQAVEKQTGAVAQQAASKTYSPIQYQPNTQPQIADTPEVVKAREEHLRLVNEANLKAQAVEQQAGSVGQQVAFKTYSPIQYQPNTQPQIADTPEVVKAREEHLRLVNEANLKAQAAEQQSGAAGQQAASKTYSPVQYLPNAQPQIADTPEVVRAREEHLRLVNEANLKVQAIEQQAGLVGQQGAFQTYSPVQPNAQPQIADTPEVVKAREEHLRLINEAKTKVQAVEHKGQQQPEFQTRFQETPEVIQARQEHLRIFNEIKSHAEKEQAKLGEIQASGKAALQSQENIEETEKILEEQRQREEIRLLEVERLREAERFQEERKQLELERMREAERLAEEQRQMELELMRLKLEEEQRLELEKYLEARRLKAEQEQKQEFVITEDYKPTQTQGSTSFITQEQQPQQLFVSSPVRSDASVAQIMQQSTVQQQLGQQQQLEQQYVNNPFLKTVVAGVQANQQQQIQQPVATQQQGSLKTTQSLVYYPVSQSDQPSQIALSGGRYIQSSQQSIGSKQQHHKEDSIKIHTADRAGYQPADTAAVLIHLEKARQDHFRAHEQALEQLRLARVNNPSLKDCN